MKNCILTVGLLALTLIGSSFGAESAPKVHTVEELTARVREKLSPLIQAALDKHCGQDCPGFKVDVQFKKTIVKDLLEDLGFSQSAPEEPSIPELQSIAVSVLIHDQVPQSSKDVLKQILTHLVNNESPVPASVQLRGLNGLSPQLDKLSKPKPEIPQNNRLVILETVIWPACAAFLALTGLIGLILFLKNRRDLIRDSKVVLQPTADVAQAPIQEEESTPLEVAALKLLESRKEDLLWLVEDLALREDTKSLNKLASIYPPQDLTSQIKFSHRALKLLASLSENRQKSNAHEVLPWLTESLDRSHWKRQEEQALPLSKLNRLSDRNRTKIFASLKTVEEKAAVLSSVPEEKWAPLLTQIGSDERVELGSALMKHQTCALEVKTKLEKQVLEEINSMIDRPDFLSSNLLDSFTLYLSEDESKKLWQEVSQGKATRKPVTLSIDSIVQELDAAATAEIFTSLDVEALGALVHHLAPESRFKVTQNLPKSLRDRLSTMKQIANEAQLLRARASLLDAYRRFTVGSMMQ